MEHVSSHIPKPLEIMVSPYTFRNADDTTKMAESADEIQKALDASHE